MDYDQLDYDLEYAPCIKLLNSEHASLIIGFLYKQFKHTQRVSIPLAELVEHLDDDLESLNAVRDGRFPRPAQAYVSTWADEHHQFIRIIAPMPGRNDRPTVELTADTERTIGWFQEMHAQSFVGTESRFLLVLQMIQDMIHKTTADPEQRLAQLEHQHNEIQQQIDDIRSTGKVDDMYSSSQIRERFFETSTLARQLLRDFHLVEDRFRDIARSVQEKQMQSDAHKGSLVEYVLDADAELKSSDQGQSFYAFWDFLMAPSQHETLYTLLEELRRIPELQSVVRTDDMLRHLPAYLIAAGEQVVQSNYRLAEQLRRILDEQARAESRRVRELAMQIKQQAHALKYDLSDKTLLLELEGPPEVSLMMERGLWEPATLIPVDKQPVRADADLRNMDFTRLHEQFFVDTAIMHERIERLLEVRTEVTLAELLEHYPLEKGLSELITYCKLAAENPCHFIDPTQSETVPLLSPSTRTDEVRAVVLPRILYRRETYEK